MNDAVLDCPACGSRIRVSLEIVEIKVPPPATRWVPPTNEGFHGGAVAVITRIAEEAGVDLEAVRSPSRKKRIVAIRRQAARAARKETDASYPEIGQVLDRDHSTVMRYLEPDV